VNRNFPAFRTLIVALLFGWIWVPVSAAAIYLVWDPSPSANVTGYAVYYGSTSGDYPNRLDIGNRTNLMFQSESGADYYLVVTAYTSDGLESLPSDEVIYQAVVEPEPVSIPAGTFSGLLALPPSGQSSASFTLKKGKRESFSGTIRLDGHQYRFSGKPEPSGVVNVLINRAGTNALSMVLNVNSDNADVLAGTLSDGNWTMQLSANRSVFNAKTNAAPYVGKYTFAVLGISGQELTPGGIGFGTVKVLPNGKVQARGTLGDGKTFSSSGFLSEDGAWPLFVSAYGRYGGLMSGWLQFETNGIDSIHGDLNWIKPAILNQKFYAAGFSNSVALIGSIYQPPPRKSTNQLLNFTNAVFTVSGADLPVGFVKDVLLCTNKVVPAIVGPDRFSFKIQNGSGLFSGRIQLPDSTVPIRFRGSLLQNHNAGYGLFIRTNQVGEALLEADL